jgi:hypothetical protein
MKSFSRLSEARQKNSMGDKNNDLERKRHERLGLVHKLEKLAGDSACAQSCPNSGFQDNVFLSSNSRQKTCQRI